MPKKKQTNNDLRQSRHISDNIGMPYQSSSFSLPGKKNVYEPRFLLAYFFSPLSTSLEDIHCPGYSRTKDLFPINLVANIPQPKFSTEIF